MGYLDLLIAVMMLFSFLFPTKAMLYVMLYLVFKGGFFAMGGDLVSWIDVFCGAYALLLAYGIAFTPITLICVFYLGQKGLFSLF